VGRDSPPRHYIATARVRAGTSVQETEIMETFAKRSVTNAHVARAAIVLSVVIITAERFVSSEICHIVAPPSLRIINASHEIFDGRESRHAYLYDTSRLVHAEDLRDARKNLAGAAERASVPNVALVKLHGNPIFVSYRTK